MEKAWLDSTASPGSSPLLPWNYALGLAMAGVVAIGAGTAAQNWLLTDAGLILLGFAGLQRPVLWTGALLLGLPLYLYPLPILPGRALNLIEIGVYGGLGLTLMRLIIGRGRKLDILDYKAHCL